MKVDRQCEGLFPKDPCGLPIGRLTQADAVLHQRDAIQEEIDTVGIHLGPRGPDRGHDPSPVGIGAVEGRLDQIGAGHTQRDRLGLPMIGRAPNLDFDQFGRALAVPDDQPSQLEADLVQRGLEGRSGGFGSFKVRVLCPSVREAEDHVVGAGLTVDRDHVEGPVDGGRQHPLKQRRLNPDIGREKGQQCGHIGMDHAGAFRDPAQGDGLPGQFQSDRDLFGPLIGCHDRTGGHPPPRGAERLDRYGDSRVDGGPRRGLADHAGGCDRDLIGRDPKMMGRLLGHVSRNRLSVEAGTGVCVSGIGHDRAERSGPDMIPRQADRRGRDPIGCEQSGRGAGLL